MGLSRTFILMYAYFIRPFWARCKTKFSRVSKIGVPLPSIRPVEEDVRGCKVRVFDVFAYPALDGMRGMGGTGATTQSIWQYWSQPPRGAIPFNWVVPEPFRVICHALLTPIIALPGGLLARWLHRTRRGGSIGVIGAALVDRSLQ